MKRFSFILSFLLMVSFSSTKVLKHRKSILITPKSTLYITGISNVTDFKCIYNIKNIDAPIPILYESVNDVIKFEKSTLILENNGFDCGGKGINRDFHGLLKSDIYPKIKLKLKEIKLYPNKKNTADALLEIELAGKSKSYHMKIAYDKDQNWIIKGDLKLNIKDFNLEAPKKILGLIVVSENIVINFKLVLQEYE
ncbi:hypothetical protein [Mariniflexile sp. AS56]|uniref:hypothetical protein n=1 Tax=Mariniflexile sp. AS56 TaxID=3063957 RepID=UPI0026EE44D7|nr:hypothetical protein [Mariniflexile sp. AS56]MDO7171112.1 hypothetical protein [Mariniflexile sp. AS56]